MIAAQVFRFFLCCSLISFGSLSVVLAQTSAAINLSKALVTAGDTVGLELDLDVPAPCTAPIYVSFQTADKRDYVNFEGSIQANQTKTKLTAQVPLDITGGTYQATAGGLNPCPGKRKGTELKVSQATLEVRAVHDNTVYPSSATLAVTVNQKQFLQTESANLQQLLNVLTAKLSTDAADTASLRKDLVLTLDAADNSLLKAQAKYKTQSGKTLNPNPLFFEDFHRHYQAAIIELRVSGNSFTDQRAQLVTFQLRPRPPMAQSNDKDERIAPNFSGSLPLVASAAISLIKQNIAAYLDIAQTGLDKFTIKLTSLPPGASISYYRIGENPINYSLPTNVLNAEFPLAIWTFRFEQKGCKQPVILTPDPYIEKTPELTAEFACKIN